MRSQSLRIVRIALTAGVLTSVYTPIAAKAVTVGNATAGDLEIHTSDVGTDYLGIGPGYERTLPVSILDTGLIVFWLRAQVAGEAVLIWVP